MAVEREGAHCRREVVVGVSGKKVAPYDFNPEFERAVVTACITRPKFWTSIGHAVEEDALASAPAKLAIKAARAIANETKKPPASAMLLVQRLKRWTYEGKITHDEVLAVSDLIDDAVDAGMPDDEDLIAELKPVLSRRMQQAALEEGLTEFQKRGDPSIALQTLERAKRLGTASLDKGIGNVLGPASFDQMAALSKVQRMKTGILELDEALSGGMMRGTETVLIGGSGGGKSMGLIQIATAAARQGFHVALATLELPEPIINARLIANLTGIPIDDILADPFTCGAMEALDIFQNEVGFGKVTVKEFTPKATTPQDLFAWCKDAEQEWGQEVSMLVVDYADKLAAKGKANREDNTYSTQGSVYEDLYVWARDDKRWVATGSQSTRGKDRGKKKVDLDDVADSMHKIRTADLVITLNTLDDMMSYLIAKNRLGKSRQTVGPLPIDYTCARISPVMPGVLIEAA